MASWLSAAVFEPSVWKKRRRIVDAIAGEGVDHQPLLVRRDHFLRRRFEIEDALVDGDDVVDERHLDSEGPAR